MAGTARADTLRVGPGRSYAVPSDAAAVAADGDVIEIDAGTYTGDVAIWRANDLVIRGAGGVAVIDAAGNNAEGKATWVIKGDNTTVEDIELTGATVPDENGAGIRQEGNGLTVRRCSFHDNENGILTSNDVGEILIEHSVFANNGFGDGFTHNMYINGATKFTLRFSYTHHTKIGHNIKSRAVENHILYNRIMDETDGTASYAINLPNGGLSVVMGNLVQQGPNTDNSTMLSYAEEGASNPSQELFVVNNTFVNDRGSGTFVRNASTTDALLVNNIFAGGGTVLSGPGTATASLEGNTPGLVDLSNFDYTLLGTSPAIDTGVADTLVPSFHYVHPAGSSSRIVVGDRIDIGAYEFGVPDDLPDAGPGPGDDANGGCGCKLRRTNPSGSRALLVLVLVLARTGQRKQRRR